MNYHNVVSAVVRALAAETINSAGGCNVEPRVQSGKIKGEIVGRDAALLADCIVHRLLHAELSPRHWNALVAKYSTHKGRKAGSIGSLVPVIATPAPYLFTQMAVMVWAIPQVRGIRREAVKLKAPRHGEDVKPWRAEAENAAIARANLKEEQKAGSRSSDMIILADSNYDMTTWDAQGLTERTYQRWNKAIRGALEGLVNDALVEAQHLLESVGVLGEEAA
ncbi:hypothetical protein [Pseudomonas sp. MWU12-2345]|uniref:hypothetical protein n=1 Tax=Pseudomonas sp. MWU12-2345 TaxID=2928689 RepID=UPI00200F130F|nr:hypothetical protein [Pseudomonas sp. MWU12-2345]